MWPMEPITLHYRLVGIRRWHDDIIVSDASAFWCAGVLIGLGHGALESGSASRWFPAYSAASITKNVKKGQLERTLLPAVDVALPVSTGPGSSSVSDSAYNGSVTGSEVLRLAMFIWTVNSCRSPQTGCSVSWWPASHGVIPHVPLPSWTTPLGDGQVQWDQSFSSGRPKRPANQMSTSSDIIVVSRVVLR